MLFSQEWPGPCTECGKPGVGEIDTTAGRTAYHGASRCLECALPKSNGPHTILARLRRFAKGSQAVMLAIKVLGWRYSAVSPFWDRSWERRSTYCTKLPVTMNDITVDYEAHRAMRGPDEARYFHWLHEIWRQRGEGALEFTHYHLHTVRYYEPGDYALAALCAVMEKEL